MSIVASKGCLPFFSSSHAEKVVGSSHVKLGELVGLGKSLKGFRHQWQGAAVWDCNHVQTTIIHTEAEVEILCIDKEAGCSSRGLRTVDKTFTKVLSDILMEGL